jgi:hypothetical protein
MAQWRKSSYSNAKEDCVEVLVSGQVGVRDSKDVFGGELHVSAPTWAALLQELDRGNR